MLEDKLKAVVIKQMHKLLLQISVILPIAAIRELLADIHLLGVI